MNDSIISIKPKHVENILLGLKTVELRTRNINLPAGSRLWVYATLPEGKIKLFLDISFIETLSPKNAWSKYGKDICITKKEFNEYTTGRKSVSAIGLTNVTPLMDGICLNTIRELDKGFQPPQFFSRLNQDSNLYSKIYKQHIEKK